MINIISQNVLRNSLILASVAGACLVGAAVPAVLSAQDQKIQKTPAKSDGADKYIQQLASEDFDARDAAMDKLRDLGEAALPALDEAGSKDANADIRWNARRLAREIRRGETGKVTKLKDLDWKASRAQDPGTTKNRKSKIQQKENKPEDSEDADQDEMDQDEMFQFTIPDLDLQFGGRGMELLRKNGGMFRLGGPNVQMLQEGRGMKMEMGPDGVKILIKEKDANGEEKQQTYSAPSMEEFKEKYPDIAEKYLNHGGFSFNFSNKGANIFQLDPGKNLLKLRGVPGLLEDTNDSTIQQIVGPENGERLGVGVKLIPEPVAQFLGLDHDLGFMVENVTSGSQAEELGLKANDVVLKINGKKIGAGGTSIREALASVEPGEKLKVEIVRGMEGKKTLEIEKSKAAKRANR